MLIFPGKQLISYDVDCWKVKVATPIAGLSFCVAILRFSFAALAEGSGVVLLCHNDSLGCRISSSVHSVSHTALVTVHTSEMGNGAAWRVGTGPSGCVFYISVSQTPDRGPVPSPGINYTGPSSYR
jgi:hypothetical protein